jgi:hypothetical protein
LHGWLARPLACGRFWRFRCWGQLVSARGYDELRDLLAEVYLPEGVEVWLTAKHRQFGGLTVDEMMDTDREDEVLAAAERLVTGAFS